MPIPGYHEVSTIKAIIFPMDIPKFLTVSTRLDRTPDQRHKRILLEIPSVDDVSVAINHYHNNYSIEVELHSVEVLP